MNTRPAVLTLDIGLTNCKASLFAVDGWLIGQASHRYPTVTDGAGRSEQNPEAWWQAIKSGLREIMQQPAAQDTDVLAISVTGHMHGLVAVDAAAEPLTPCWTLFDRRAEAEARELRKSLGPSAFRITGGRLEACTPAAKILWLQRHRPDLLRQTAHFLAPKDVVRCRLGGDIVTDPIDAAGTVLFDLAKRAWAAELLEAVGARPEQMPEVWASCADAGCLSRAAGQELGLRPGIPLIVGAGDDVEALGASVTRPGLALEHVGTTGTLIACTPEPVFDPEQVVEVYPHVLPGVYLLGGATNAAGRSLDWARAFVPNPADPMTLPLTYPPPSGAPRPPVYLPYILGERGLLWDSAATGAFLGLRESHTPADLAAGVYEGVAFSLRELLAGIQRLAGRPVAIVSGAPLAHRPWAQMRADVYGLPLRFSDAADLTGLGAALLALVNRGVFGSLAEATDKCCSTAEQVTPDPAQTAYYDRVFGAYVAAVAACRPLFDRLS